MAAPSTEALAVEAPRNLDAEDTVLGALLLAGTQDSAGVVNRVREAGLQPFHFYRESNGRLYAKIVHEADQGAPFDPLTIAAHPPLNVEPERIHELASLVPAIGLAPHHATLIVETHHRRQAFNIGKRLTAASLNGGIPADLTVDLQQLLDQPTGHSTQLRPLWLEQAMVEPIPSTSEYVEGVLEAGVLADIVGLPYLHKSAVALELAVKVAKGRGLFLGQHSIKAQAKVAYFWADDSRPQELKRIQAYAAANSLDDQPVGFYLNPGITLPDDIPAVRQQIIEHGYRLAVFDSLYNFADFDFVKDTGAVKHLYTALKRVCDEIEGLTIVLVDHASKPSDSNRDRDDSITSFGSVWKAAAVRCSIVVTKKGSSLFVSATGNNVKGFPRTPAYFNRERLELAIAEPQEADPERETRIEELVLEHVLAHPGHSTNQITKSVKGRAADIIASLTRLEAGDLICDTYGSSSQLLGKTPEELSNDRDESSSPGGGKRKGKTAWIPLNKAKEVLPDPAGKTPEEPLPAHGSSAPQNSSETSSLYVVEGGSEEPAREPQGHNPDEVRVPFNGDPEPGGHVHDDTDDSDW